jgi:hypothetical protein
MATAARVAIHEWPHPSMRDFRFYSLSLDPNGIPLHGEPFGQLEGLLKDHGHGLAGQNATTAAIIFSYLQSGHGLWITERWKEGFETDAKKNKIKVAIGFQPVSVIAYRKGSHLHPGETPADDERANKLLLQLAASKPDKKICEFRVSHCRSLTR